MRNVPAKNLTQIVNAKRQWEMIALLSGSISSPKVLTLLCRGRYFRNFTAFDSKSRIPMQLEDSAVSDYATPTFY